MSHDVIVIGSGPAGGSAARVLAQGGARVLLLERHRLPRDKPCGGGITPRAAQLLGAGIERSFETIVETTRWGFEDHPDTVDLPTGSLGMVRRRSFDLHLVELASGAGQVTVNDGVTVDRIEEDGEGVTVTARSGEQWRAAHVVGADGAAGVTARCIGLQRRTPAGIALDADVEVDPAVFEEEARRATFALDAVEQGYAWIFPKAGYLSCGVGSGSHKVPLPPALDAYLERVFPKGSIKSQIRRGHRLPLYEGPARAGTARVFLTGDAVSLVDPIMGEGIAGAVASGQIAAAMILERLGGAPLDDGLEYSRRLHDAVGVELDELRRYILPIATRDPALFFRRFFLERGNYLALARSLGERLDRSLPHPFPAAAIGAICPDASARKVQS